MPWKSEWIEADMFMRWMAPNGDLVEIYHTYDDDLYENGPCQFWFCLRPESGWGDDDVFDIRDIAKILGIENVSTKNEHHYILIKGIESGIITPDKIILPNET